MLLKLQDIPGNCVETRSLTRRTFDAIITDVNVMNGPKLHSCMFTLSCAETLGMGVSELLFNDN